MNINRDNYEAYFLDFIEGRLSQEQEEVLHRFLKFNPDLETELNAFELHTIDTPALSFPGKEAMKKEHPGDGTTVREANFDMFCIAWLEGDLTEVQRKSFENYLALHPEKENVVAAYRATRLEPAQVKYPHKSRLKKRGTRVVDWRILVPVAAAAAIALLVIVSGPESQTTMEVASVVEPEQAEAGAAGPEQANNGQIRPAEASPDQTNREENSREQTDKKRGNQNQQRSDAIQVQATFNMVRKTNSPVPVSDFTDAEKIQLQQQDNNQDKQGQTGASRRIAGVDLSKQQPDLVSVPHDRIRAQSIQPPTINNSSLSILALARYQAQKASQVMEEEDALLWNLASSGIRELSRITGTEAELLASRDEDGAISGIRFKSRFLNVTAPISREE